MAHSWWGYGIRPERIRGRARTVRVGVIAWYGQGPARARGAFGGPLVRRCGPRPGGAGTGCVPEELTS